VILILNNGLSGRAVFVFYSLAGKTYERVTRSTPVSDYKDINGFNLATYGEAVWSFPGGDFCYTRFNIMDIQYNPERLR
jgi:hypothetical protein